jgi:hypothetical protein
VVESAAESVDKLVGVRRGVAKAGHKWGNFALCWRVWQTVGSAPDGKSFHDVANGRDGCTMVPLSRSKRRFRNTWFRNQCWRRDLLLPRRKGATPWQTNSRTPTSRTRTGQTRINRIRTSRTPTSRTPTSRTRTSGRINHGGGSRRPTPLRVTRGAIHYSLRFELGHLLRPRSRWADFLSPEDVTSNLFQRREAGLCGSLLETPHRGCP